MKPLLVLALMTLSNSQAHSQTVLMQATKPGDVSFMSVVVQPGVGMVHPMISLKDGTACDLTDPVCIFRAEDEFGPSVWDLYRSALKKIAGRN